MSSHQKLSEWEKVASRFTEIVYKSSSEDSRKCRRRFKLFVDLLDSLKQGTTGKLQSSLSYCTQGMFVIFLVQPTSHRISETRRKHLKAYIVLCLLLRFSFFWPTMPLRKEVSPTVCLFERLIIGQFIRKSCFLDRLFACWISKKGASFFICEEC